MCLLFLLALESCHVLISTEQTNKKPFCLCVRFIFFVQCVFCVCILSSFFYSHNDSSFYNPIILPVFTVLLSLGVVGQMSCRKSDRFIALMCMHSSLQAESVAEMAVMNHRPAAIDGVVQPDSASLYLTFTHFSFRSDDAHTVGAVLPYVHGCSLFVTDRFLGRAAVGLGCGLGLLH